MESPSVRRKALAAAFPQTIPILTGFAFLGFTYGIYMNVSGFPFWYPMFMALIIFGGSLVFVVVGFLLSPFPPAPLFLLALFFRARPLFYGFPKVGM